MLKREACMSGDLIVYGDRHGQWAALFRACDERRPLGVIILGDCDLDMPFRDSVLLLKLHGASVAERRMHPLGVVHLVNEPGQISSMNLGRSPATSPKVS